MKRRRLNDNTSLPFGYINAEWMPTTDIHGRWHQVYTSVYLIIGGTTGSGNSTFCIRFLKNLDTLCTEPNFPGEIIWCYSEQSAVPRQLLAALRKKRPDSWGCTRKFWNRPGQTLSFYSWRLVKRGVFTSRVWPFCQRQSPQKPQCNSNYPERFYQAPHCRDISLNAKYLVALKNVRGRHLFAYLAHQVLPEASVSLCETYREATQNAHGYLILDFAQDTDDLLRFRTNVFPSEHPPIIYA